jgi:hypothetical protein
MVIVNAHGLLVPGPTLFRDLKPGEDRVVEGKRQVCGVALFVIGMRLPSGEYLLLVTDKEPETALKDDAQRGEIETLFGALKSRGFRFEETHMTEPQRLSKLIALLALAFCWAHLTGEGLHTHQPIPVKKQGRKAISIFRYGLDYLREILFNGREKQEAFKAMVALLRAYLTGCLPSLGNTTEPANTPSHENFFPPLEESMELARAA